MATRTKTPLAKTTSRGLGHRHQVAVKGLFDVLQDGSPCDWCGRPRWRDRTRNYDYDPTATNPASGKLQGDHSGMSRSEALRRGLPIPLADRLLHGRCNGQRSDGYNDHLAANKAGAAAGPTPTLVMPWPW